MDLLAFVIEAGKGAFTDDGGLIATLALAGLVGGFGHCAGMCGPFVLAQTTAQLADVPAARMGPFTRIAGALLVPYHLGRIVTYGGLGAGAALAAGTLRALPGFAWLSATLLGLAALFFLGYGLARLGLPWSGPFAGIGGGTGGVGRRLGRLAAPLFARPLGWRGFALGMSLGFLPCGLVYGALAAAAAGGSAASGALAMAGFGLGTAPALIGVGAVGHFAARRWRRPSNLIGAALMVVNAGILGWFAWRAAA